MTRKTYSAIDYAMKYLAHHPRSERDIEIMLLKKGYLQDEIDVAKKRLSEVGVLDDAKYVRLYIDSEVIKKGKPIIKIKQKLLSKGVDHDLIQAYCDENWDAIREGMIQRVHQEIERYKRQGYEGVDVIQRVERKGYPLGYIREVVRRKELGEME